MKRSSKSLAAIISCLILAAGTTSAQQAKNAWEKAEDRQQIRQDRVAIADDRADLDRLSSLIEKWDDYRSQGNTKKMRDVQRQIAKELRRDLAEAANQAALAKREVRQSTREIYSERDDLAERQRVEANALANQEKENAARANAQVQNERHDLRDDRRDRRDDVRDMVKAEEILAAKREVALELRNVQSKIDRGVINEDEGYRRQEELYNSYLVLSRREITLGHRELREDHRELREDRRETREDRRQF